MAREDSPTLSRSDQRLGKRARKGSVAARPPTPAAALPLVPRPVPEPCGPGLGDGGCVRQPSGARIPGAIPRKRSRELSSASLVPGARLDGDLVAKDGKHGEGDPGGGGRDARDHREMLAPVSGGIICDAPLRPLSAVVAHCGLGRMGPPQPLISYPFPSSDDADGHIVYKLGDGLGPTPMFPQGRYRILGLLGEGTFGKVLKCWDHCDQGTAAIKVVRAIPKYREAARIEVEILNHLQRNDPEDWYHYVKLLSWFEFRGHVCMVFEELGPTLYDLLRQRQFQPFTLDQVREYAWQLLESVQFLHSLALIHTDLKPENILHDESRPMSRTGSAIKLIDFGSATFDSWKHNEVISTRHYRAPEVILGCGWTYPCDLWSVGCILAELYTGEVLFQTHHDLEHLALMNAVLGPVPPTMAARVNPTRRKHFRTDSNGLLTLNWPEGATSRASVRAVRKTKRLVEVIPGHSDLSVSFLDLLTKLLAFEPSTRCTPSEALRHPFFRTATDSEIPTLSSGSSACGAESLSLLLGSAPPRKFQNGSAVAGDQRDQCRDEAWGTDGIAEAP